MIDQYFESIGIEIEALNDDSIIFKNEYDLGRVLSRFSINPSKHVTSPMVFPVLPEILLMALVRPDQLNKTLLLVDVKYLVTRGSQKLTYSSLPEAQDALREATAINTLNNI